MEGKCPHCGKPLPAGAVFCPHCAKSINRRVSVEGIRPASQRWLYLLLVLLAAAAAVTALLLLNQPQTFDGQGEVIYPDADGDIQLVLAWSDSSYDPLYEVNQNATIGEQYRFPARLYAHRVDNGEDAAQTFLEKVEQVDVEFLPPEGAGIITGSEPAPNNGYDPNAALISYVDYTAQEDFRSQMVWTFQMKNGDTIRLRQDYVISTIPVYDFYPEDTPMGTTQELQALLDRLPDQVEPGAEVNIHLPAVTYQGNLTISSRSVNLCGSTQGEGRTTFTGSIRIDVEANQWIVFIQDIDFAGAGDGVAVSTASSARTVNCTFTNWKTGVLGYGSAWVNVIGCTFTDNVVGFHFNSEGRSANHSMYNNNVFRDNETAVLLERVPTDVALNFQDSVFAGNGTDIDNRCGQDVDTSQAVFE